MAGKRDDSMTLFVVDIGGTSIKTAIYSEQTLSHLYTFPTPNRLEKMVGSLSNRLRDLSEIEIEGVAISSPGAVDREEQVVHGISAVPYIHDIPFGEHLKNQLNLPVSIENDANCAALAELEMGAGKKANNVLFLILGTGIGGAVIVNRELVQGPNYSSGEFGCMLINDTKENFSRLGSPINTVSYYKKLANLTEDNTITGVEVFTLAENGDVLAIKAINRFYKNVAKGIYNLLMVFDPDLILIGGGISSRDDLIPNLKKQIDILLYEQSLKTFKYEIKSCAFKNNANLIGAAISFQRQYKENK